MISEGGFTVLEFDMTQDHVAQIKVVGVGGGGNNAVDRMIEENLKGVEFITINTDKQALGRSKATTKIQIGKRLQEDLEQELILKLVVNLLKKVGRYIRGFKRCRHGICYSRYGWWNWHWCSSGCCQDCKEEGILTVGVVTKPFSFEGKKRMMNAEKGINELKQNVDTLVIIPNDKLLQIIDKRTSMLEAFRKADEVLRQGVQGISDLISNPGIINLDFADVRTIMSDKGIAHMGIGQASGENKTEIAAKAAIHSPLLDTSIDGAKGVLINISGGSNLGLLEANEAANLIRESVDPEAEIIFGTTINDDLGDNVIVTVIATGFENKLSKSVKVPITDNINIPFKEEENPPVL